MQHWHVTAADRDESGKIKIARARTLSDLLPPAAPMDDDEQPEARPWSWMDVAATAVVLALGAALFVLIGQTTPPLPANSSPVLAPPTAAATLTPAPSATVPPTASPAPTSAPIFVPPPPTEVPIPTPCDPLTAPYQAKQQVFPIGSVVGVSCVSPEEAQANAQALADAMRQTATEEARK